MPKSGVYVYGLKEKLMFKELLNLIFYDGCISCSNMLVKGEEQICLSCFSQLEPTNFHLSPKDNDLYFRFAGKVPLEGATSLFYFDKKARFQKIIHALKYEDIPELGIYLGKYLGEILKNSNFMEGIEAIIPVPLHPHKERMRGYNQAEKVAEGLQSIFNIPIQKNAIKRIKKTDTQTAKSKKARWENVADAFMADQPTHKNILIIDDVITTGSTVEACIRALLQKANPPQIIKVASLGVGRGI